MTDSWEKLFDRAAEYEIALDDAQHELAEYRDG
jgi:hypothetical protein